MADEVLPWVTALGGLAGFVALGLTVWKDRGRRSLPNPELRGLLEDLIEDLGNVAASGGAATPWFLDPSRRQRELRLASLNGAVVDDDLNGHIAACRASYLNCYGLSTVTGRPAMQKQVDEARAGSASAGRALDRVNALSRKFGHL